MAALNRRLKLAEFRLAVDQEDDDTGGNVGGREGEDRFKICFDRENRERKRLFAHFFAVSSFVRGQLQIGSG
jgi:hypothetical protein